MSDQVVRELIESNGERFEISTYNDIAILTHLNTGYINATKLCAKMDRDFRTFCKSVRFRELSKVFDEEIEPAQLCAGSKLGIKYELRNEFPHNVLGQYIHPKFVNFVCEWCSLRYAFKVARIMDLVNEELHLRQITLDQKISELETHIETLRSKKRGYKTRLSNVNSGFNRELVGSIIIHKHTTRINRYIVKFSRIKVSRTYDPSDVIIHMHNACEIHRIANYYLRVYGIEGITYISHNNFEAEDINAIINYIKNIQNFNVDIVVDYNEMLKSFMLGVAYGRKRIYNYNQGKLFEMYCAQKYNIPMYNATNSEILGLTKQDIGCDLMSMDEQVIAQCKYYTKRRSRLTERALHSFFTMAEHFDDYRAVLFINSSCNLECELPDGIELVRVPDEDISAFIHQFDDEINRIIDEDIAFAIEQMNIIFNTREEENRLAVASKQRTRSYTLGTKTNIEGLLQARSLGGVPLTREFTLSMREFMGSIIKTYPGITLDEAKDRLYQRFAVSFSNKDFGVMFSDLYEHSTNSSFLQADNETGAVTLCSRGTRVLFPTPECTVGDEIAYIVKYMGIREFITDEYIEHHNRVFGRRYTKHNFKILFNHLFTHDTACLLRRSVHVRYHRVPAHLDGKRIHVFQLKEFPRQMYYKRVVDSMLDENDTINMEDLLLRMYDELHVYESGKSLAAVLRTIGGYKLTIRRATKTEIASGVSLKGVSPTFITRLG